MAIEREALAAKRFSRMVPLPFSAPVAESCHVCGKPFTAAEMDLGLVVYDEDGVLHPGCLFAGRSEGR